MLKKAFTAVLLMISCLVFGQTKPTIGVLPFTGGPSGDGDTITTLLSYQSDIMEAFTVVPRTNAVTALVNEPDFQLASSTDSDTIGRMGRMLGANYVVSGQIRRVGDRNLLVTSVVSVDTLQLLGGDYREYRRLDDVPALLPGIANVIISATQRDTSRLPALAIAPISVAKDGTNPQEAESLGQILTIEIANSGRYAVLPRTSTMQDELKRLQSQPNSYTPEDGARAMGRAINARYVLSTEVHTQGFGNTFTASILSSDDGSLSAIGYRDYRSMNDGVAPMADLAHQLSPAIVVPPPAPIAPPVPVPVQPQPTQVPQPAPVLPPQPAPEPVPVQPAPVQPVPAPAPVPVQPAPSAPEPVPVEPAPSVPEPAPAQQVIPVQPPQTAQQQEPIRVEPSQPTQKEPAKPSYFSGMFNDPARLWTVGVSVGTAFTRPWFIGTVHGTIAPVKHSFLELGFDFGLVSGSSIMKSYYAMYPYAHIAYFKPFSEMNLSFLSFTKGKGGCYIGAGASYMMSYYEISLGGSNKGTHYNIISADLTAGVNLFDMIDVSYTLRAAPWEKLTAVSNKLSVGYVYRF